MLTKQGDHNYTTLNFVNHLFLLDSPAVGYQKHYNTHSGNSQQEHQRDHYVKKTTLK